MNQQVQQEIRNERVLDKARLIASAKRVRRSEVNKNIWLVGSGNPRTPTKFYCIKWNTELECLMSDCKAFEFSPDNTCKHQLAIAIKETS